MLWCYFFLSLFKIEYCYILFLSGIKSDILYLMGVLDGWCLYLYQARFQEPFVFQFWIPNLFLSFWWKKIWFNVVETNWLTLLISPRAQLRTWAKILSSGFEFLPSFSSAFYNVGFIPPGAANSYHKSNFKGKTACFEGLRLVALTGLMWILCLPQPIPWLNGAKS